MYWEGLIRIDFIATDLFFFRARESAEIIHQLAENFGVARTVKHIEFPTVQGRWGKGSCRVTKQTQKSRPYVSESDLIFYSS